MAQKSNISRRKFLSNVAKLSVLTACSEPAFAFYHSRNHHNTTFLPDWQEGWLDIHQISTGRGNSAFIICPDGTTMLIDAGELGVKPVNLTMPPVPNDSKTSGECIADYIRRFSKPLNQDKPFLDYVFLTHFHRDHIGCKPESNIKSHGYSLSGISMVAEHVDIGKIIDRGYPDYDFPSKETVLNNNDNVTEYIKFVDYQQKNRNTVFECFEAGSRSQFVLRHNPDKYKDFNIQNIYVNGKVWTGEGTNTKVLFSNTDKTDENMLSGVIKMTYGAFNYYSGGDSIGAPGRDVETHTCEVIGQVDAMITNHHAQQDATNTRFLEKLRPQVMVIAAWDWEHPHPNALSRMVDKSIYPDEREIFTTGMFKAISENLGENARFINPWGHIVIRAYEDGKKFQAFVLDAETGDFQVKYSTEKLVSANASL